MMQAVMDAKFFELSEYLGPSKVPLHGPENTLQIEFDGRVRKVYLLKFPERFQESGPRPSSPSPASLTAGCSSNGQALPAWVGEDS